jgi:hypothetical protein
VQRMQSKSKYLAEIELESCPLKLRPANGCLCISFYHVNNGLVKAFKIVSR